MKLFKNSTCKPLNLKGFIDKMHVLEKRAVHTWF